MPHSYIQIFPDVFRGHRKWTLTWKGLIWKTNPAGNYLLKVNNRNTRTRCEICSKLTIKIPERCTGVINFEDMIAGWEYCVLIDFISQYKLWIISEVFCKSYLSRSLFRLFNTIYRRTALILVIQIWFNSKFTVRKTDWLR